LGLSAIDFFCGAGGASTGLKQAGFEVILGVELGVDPKRKTKTWRDPARTYHANVGEVVQMDIRDINPSRLPPADLDWFSPPCQEISNARWASKKGPTYDLSLVDRSREIVKAHKPRFYVIENVPPLKKFYKGVQLLNAAWCGVPQNRIRAFICNFSLDWRSKRKPHNFPTVLGHDGFHPGDQKKIVENPGDYTWPTVAGKNGFANRFTNVFPDTVWPSVMGERGFAQPWLEDPDHPGFRKQPHHGSLGWLKKGGFVFPTVNSSNGFSDIYLDDDKVVGDFARRAREGKKVWEGIGSLKELKDGALVFPTAAGTHGFSGRWTSGVPRPNVPSDNGLRWLKITNEFLAAVQGFPEDYKWVGSKKSVRKQIVNAVPPPMAKWIGERLKSLIEMGWLS